MICPECGAEFAPTNGRQRFCSPVHKTAFHHRQASRGQVLVSFAQTWRVGKHGAAPGASAWAMAQMCALLDGWNAEDRAVGRAPRLVVEERMATNWRAADVLG